MYKIVKDKQPFQVVGSTMAFTIPYSTTATLYMSADGVNYYPYEQQIKAPDTIIVNGCVTDMYFYIDGINDDLKVLI